jgi:predicted Zn-dependent protease
MSTASDQNRFPARLGDGRTAASRPVGVRLGEQGIEIGVPGERRAALTWPYEDMRSSVPVVSGARDVLLSRTSGGAETLYVADPDFARVLVDRARHLSAGRQRLSALRPGLAVLALVVAVIGLARFLEFRPAQTIARLMPQPTREAMGHTVVAQLTGTMRRCEAPAGRAALDKLTNRLVKAGSDEASPVRVVMVDWQLVNAFAAPGGQIIMTRGLVQKASSPDEVAGVLAHEIGHTLELHPEAGLVRALGLTAAAQLIFAGSTGTATNIGILLTQLRYTRVAEREADVHALRILKTSGISAKGFGDFFERLDPKPATTEPAADKKDDAKASPGFAKRIFESDILRSHPQTKARLDAVRAQPAYPATPALDEAEWRALREMCGPAVSPPAVQPRPQLPPPRPQTTAPPPPPQAGTPTDPDRQIADATRILEQRPNDVDALQRRAMAYNQKGRHAEAVADLTKATSLRPNDPNLHSARGGVHYSARQYELALAAYSEAIRLEPNHVFARNGRGNTQRALKQFEPAVADFSAAIAARPSYVLTYFNRALTFADMGRDDDAISDLSTAIGIDREYAAAYTQRGILNQRKGLRDEAVKDYRAALAAPATKYGSGAWAHRVARERLTALGVSNP